MSGTAIIAELLLTRPELLKLVPVAQIKQGAIAQDIPLPALLIVDPKTNGLLNSGKTSALSNARALTPQALADWLAGWTR